MSFKKSIRNIAYAGITLATLVAASCRPEPAYDSRNSNNIPRLTESYSSSGLKSESKSHTKPKYTLRDFKRVLGDRVIPEREGELEKLWHDDSSSNGEKGRETLYNIYSDYKKFYGILSESEKKRFDKFNPYEINNSELESLQKAIPWKLFQDNKFSDSDKALLYFIYSFQHLHL